MRNQFLLASTVALGLFAGQASATVDVMLPYTIAYEELQSGDLCLVSMVSWAEIGIPEASAAQASFAPSLILRTNIGRPSEQININVLANQNIVAQYADESYPGNGVINLKFSLDMGAFSAANGLSTEGRQKTIDYAKLSILALTRNAELLNRSGKYQVDVEVQNLPSQQGLRGSTVHAKTRFPYTSSSPVLATYRKELLNLTGNCPTLTLWK
jgi:hypothetical protein